MINFRYHIISITAVFLALGLGLALGTSFGNRALVSDLQARQDDLDVEVRNTRSQNDQLTGALNRQVDREDRFAEQAVTGPFMSGQLTGVPVLVVAPKGIDENALQLVRTALASSGAEFAGTVRLDSRLTLAGDNPARLAKVMDVPATDPSQVRQVLVDRLSTLLLDAAGPGTPPGLPSTTTTTPTPPSTTTTPPGATTTTPPGDTSTSSDAATTGGEGTSGTEPALITGLRQEGFIEVEPPSGGSTDDPILTGTNYRYLFVTGPNADVPDDQFLYPLVRRMAQDRPQGIPVVVAAGVTGDILERDKLRAQILAPLRDDAALGGRISTVDDVETYEGIFASILAIDELGQGTHGQYGVGDGVDPLPGS